MAAGDLLFLGRRNLVYVWKDQESEDEVGELHTGDAIIILGEGVSDLFDPATNETRKLIPVLTRFGKGFVWDAALASFV
jgi:hypothetical protein